jgi:transposase
MTSVWVPGTQHEAVRDLVRARETAMYWRNKARQALSSFLLRQGYRYNGTKAWTVAYWRWLATLEMEHPAQQIAMQEYILAIQEADAHHDRLVQQIEAAVPNWSMAPLVAALQSMRGIALITATTIVGEIGDISRFESPRRLLAYLGLVPAEHSSGTKIRRRGITKAGDARVRRLLVESAWTYCRSPRVSQSIQLRQEGLDLAIIQTAWKAQLRLHARYRRLSTTGKPKNVVITAVAREFVGFVRRIAGFEKDALVSAKRFVDETTLPDDARFPPRWMPFARPWQSPARVRIAALLGRGLQTRPDVELELGRHVAGRP